MSTCTNSPPSGAGQLGNDLVGTGQRGACLVHAADRDIVSHHGWGSTGISDYLNFLPLSQQGQHWIYGADVVGDAGHDELCAASGFNGSSKVLIIHCVDNTQTF